MIQIDVCRSFDQVRDLPGLVSLIHEQLNFTGRNPKTCNEINSVVEGVLKDSNGGVFFIASSRDQTPVGFAYGNISRGLESGGRYLWLNELYAADGHRRRGTALSLLEFIQDWARRTGCVYISLVTSPENKAAQELYMKAGFSAERMIWIDKYL